MEDVTTNIKATGSAKSFGTILSIAFWSTFLWLFIGLSATELFRGQVWFWKIFGSSEGYGIGIVILAPFFFGAVALVTAFYMYFRDFLKKRNKNKDSL